MTVLVEFPRTGREDTAWVNPLAVKSIVGRGPALPDQAQILFVGEEAGLMVDKSPGEAAVMISNALD